MNTRNIIVVPYNEVWKSEFQIIKAFLFQKLSNKILSIEHVGSTSVEGLSAKPIIDIDIVIESYEHFDVVRSLLYEAGYFYLGDLGIKEREAFGYDDKPEFMEHHLYVCPQNSRELKRHVTFRDYLRLHKEDRDRYSEIKMLGAEKFPQDIDSYIDFKGTLIEEIYRKCGLIGL